MMRGQITMFMIIGIVLLFSLGFTIYLVNTLHAQAAHITVEPQNTAMIGCVRSAAVAAFQAVGEEGGTNSPPQATINAKLMHIGITATPDSGYVSFEPLCLALGPNRPCVDPDHCPTPERTCLPATYQTVESASATIQDYLDRAIEGNIVYCGVHSNVTVIFGGDDVSIVTDNVSLQLPVRFKRVFNLAFTVALDDAADPLFDKRAVAYPDITLGGCDGPAGACVFQWMSVTSQRIDADYSVVRVTDSDPSHQIGGKPFIFQYVVEHRQPVLTVPDSSAANPILYSPGDTLTVSVADPDEEDVTLSCDPPGLATCPAAPVSGIGAASITMNAAGDSAVHTLTVTASADRTASTTLYVQDTSAAAP